MRYRFYREHKYINYVLSELERSIAKTDFSLDNEVIKIKEQLDSVESLLKAHATYEDQSLHPLLEKKGSLIHKSIENDHQLHEAKFGQLKKLLDRIKQSINDDEQVSLGYSFYLFYRQFVSENSQHLHQEETIILSELQRFYSDDELRQVEFNTYSHMTPDQMVHMMEVLFPHMNPNDHEAFLIDIKDSEPEKFKIAWKQISLKLSNQERSSIMKKLNIND